MNSLMKYGNKEQYVKDDSLSKIPSNNYFYSDIQTSTIKIEYEKLKDEMKEVQLILDEERKKNEEFNTNLTIEKENNEKLRNKINENTTLHENYNQIVKQVIELQSNIEKLSAEKNNSIIKIENQNMEILKLKDTLSKNYEK